MKNKPHWSLITCFYLLLAIVGVASAISIFVLKHPLWIELEVVVSILSLSMFVFFTWVLYAGVRFSPDESLSIRLPLGKLSDVIGNGDSSAFNSFGSFSSGASDPLELIFALVIDIILCIFLAFLMNVLLWLGVNLFAISIIVISLPLFYIFKSSVIFLTRHSAECHGLLGKSVLVSLGYTLLQSTILYLIIYGSHWIAARVSFL